MILVARVKWDKIICVLAIGEDKIICVLTIVENDDFCHQGKKVNICEVFKIWKFHP